MEESELIKKVRSGIVSISFYKNDEKIASGSGFLCKKKLISNNHVFMTPDGLLINESQIKVFSGADATDPILEQGYEEFMQTLVCGSDRINYDYAVFDIKIDHTKHYQFHIGDHQEIEEGEKVLILGFPFEIENLTSHIGYISSKYTSGNVNLMQLDASVNSGNSGGPLVNPKTLNVVGIVTRKYTGLYKQFDDLIKSFEENAKILDNVGGIMGLSRGEINIDPMKALAISQRQMKQIAENIKRSANTGIGYAFSCDKLKEEDFYNKK